MRRAVFFIFAAGLFISQPSMLWAEEPVMLKGGVSMDADLNTETQSMLDAEDSRHDGKMTALDSKERGLEDAHESEMEAIDKQENLKGDAKERTKKEKTASHEKKMRDLERERAMEEKIHAKRVGEIMKKGKKLLSDAASAAGAARPSNPRADTWSDESIPGRMMKLAGELDRIADDIEGNAMKAGNKFFGRMSRSVSKTAEFYAQDPEVPLGQMINSLITYLNNDQKKNEEMLYDEAAKAVEDMQSDPVSFLGEHAIDIAMSATGAAGELAEARAVTAAGELGAAGKMRQTAENLAKTPLQQQLKPPPQRPHPSPPPSSPPPLSRPSPTPRPSSPPPRPTPLPPARPSYTPPPRTSPPPPRPTPLPPSRPSYTPPPHPTPIPPPRTSPPPTRPTPPPPPRPTPQIERQKQAQALEKAGQTLKGMAENARKFSTFNLRAGSAAPDYAKIFPGVKGDQGPVNFVKSIDKNAGNNNCFPIALAAAKRRITGKPYIALDHNPHMPIKDPISGKVSYGDVPTDPDVVYKVLKENFGEGKAKDPYYGGLEGLKSHQEGVPIEMKGLKSSKEREIRTSVGFGKENHQGMVFVDGGEGTPGHVFNVWRNGNQVEFWDLQPEVPVQILSFSETEVVMQCGIWKETATVDWKRVFYYRLD